MEKCVRNIFSIEHPFLNFFFQEHTLTQVHTRKCTHPSAHTQVHTRTMHTNGLNAQLENTNLNKYAEQK